MGVDVVRGDLDLGGVWGEGVGAGGEAGGCSCFDCLGGHGFSFSVGAVDGSVFVAVFLLEMCMVVEILVFSSRCVFPQGGEGR